MLGATLCDIKIRQWLAGGRWFFLGTPPKNWESRYNWNIVKSGVKYKYVVNQKLEHVDDLSFREPFGRIMSVLFYKIRPVPFLAQGICIYIGHSF